jgi:hypothetical protein
MPGAQQADTMTSEGVATPMFQGISSPIAAQAVDATLLCLIGLFFFGKCNAAHRHHDESLRTIRRHYMRVYPEVSGLSR